MSETVKHLKETKRELPDGWRWVKLAEVASTISKGTTPTTLGLQYTDAGIPFLRAEDVNGWAIEVDKVAFHISNDADEVLSRSRLLPGDFLITIAGTLGRVGYVPSEVQHLNCNQAVAFARIDQSKVDVQYLCFACSLEHIIAPLLDQKAGGALQNLNLLQIRCLCIPLPPLAEQQRIAGVLREQMTAVEKAREAAQARLGAVKALPAAFLRQVFPQPGQPIPVGWRSVKLGEVCAQDRQIVEPNTAEADSLTYYSLEHIESETGRILKVPIDHVEAVGKSTTFRFNERHVLYGKLRPYLNKVSLPESPGRCTTEMIPLISGNDIDRVFLAWVLRRRETVEFAMQEKTGSRMPRADMDSLLTCEIPIPLIAEQQRIAGVLFEQMAAVNKVRAVAEEELNTINALPAALLRRAFNGEI